MQHDPIKAKIIELIPEIRGQGEYGLDWCDKHGLATGVDETIDCPDCNFSCRPITLADVLRAIYTQGLAMKTRLTVECDGQFIYLKDVEKNGSLHQITGPTWNLTTDYDGQTQEVKEFIGKLLGV